jgi:hypothetical protein
MSFKEFVKGVNPMAQLYAIAITFGVAGFYGMFFGHVVPEYVPFIVGWICGFIVLLKFK